MLVWEHAEASAAAAASFKSAFRLFFWTSALLRLDYRQAGSYGLVTNVSVINPLVISQLPTNRNAANGTQPTVPGSRARRVD